MNKVPEYRNKVLCHIHFTPREQTHFGFTKEGRFKLVGGIKNGS